MKYLDLNLSPQVQMVIGIRNKCELLLSIFQGFYLYDPEAMKGRQFNFLDEGDLFLWKEFQEGEPFKFLQHVRNYDPEAAPRELGIRSKTMSFYALSFHCETYTESLALLGSMSCAEMGDEGNSVAGLAVELKHSGKEAANKNGPRNVTEASKAK